ncbi:unnamed protein product [Thelazia callipaeda]|uniref:Protein quiver n=1 Tax=Thelazia callipaeda TaxID=103827 RepID=A0A0N5D9A7_THECL|nr:unnamed protein product [Thelazia callipaeda]
MLLLVFSKLFLLIFVICFAGTIPRRFECFSCMSLSYQERWEHLQYIYTAPKVFTNRCNEPQLSNHIPTIICSTMCVNLLEPDVEAGLLAAILTISMNRVDISDLNNHLQIDQCRNLPRAHLYNLDRKQPHPIFGDVQLCTCHGDRCNGSSNAIKDSNYNIALLLICLTALLRICNSNNS